MSTTEDAPQIPREVLQAYFQEQPLRVKSLGKGNINDTYLLSTPLQKAVLQRVSSTVFPEPAAVATNFQKITKHIRKAAEEASITYRCAELIPTTAGAVCYVDAMGECWRAQSYIEHALPTGGRLDCNGAVQLGRVLARFHQLTQQVEVSTLSEPIPGFHRTLRYYDGFDMALQQMQVAEESLLSECVEYAERFRSKAGVLERARASGELPLGVMHGDPKLDNVIWDSSGRAVGLFDLDTVGPGLRLYDLGDCLRSSCNLSGEEVRRHEVTFSADIFRAVLHGYCSAGDNLLSATEKELVFDSALVITVELGVRFLTDYLSGDIYFKTSRLRQNLDRALVQFLLAETMIAEEKRLRDSVC